MKPFQIRLLLYVFLFSVAYTEAQAFNAPIFLGAPSVEIEYLFHFLSCFYTASVLAWTAAYTFFAVPLGIRPPIGYFPSSDF